MTEINTTKIPNMSQHLINFLIEPVQLLLQITNWSKVILKKDANHEKINT